jgi:hypothetical protein
MRIGHDLLVALAIACGEVGFGELTRGPIVAVVDTCEMIAAAHSSGISSRTLG